MVGDPFFESFTRIITAAPIDATGLFDFNVQAPITGDILSTALDTPTLIGYMGSLFCSMTDRCFGGSISSGLTGLFGPTILFEAAALTPAPEPASGLLFLAGLIAYLMIAGACSGQRL
jgi:hypothetical protein